MKGKTRKLDITGPEPYRDSMPAFLRSVAAKAPDRVVDPRSQIS
jgi:hypothetical protein